MPVEPLLELLLVFWYLALLLWPFMHMATAGVFFVVDPVTPLIIEDVPQVSLVGRRSLAVLGWRTRSMAAHGRWTPSLPPLLELLLKPPDELLLFLNEAVLSPNIILDRVFVVKVGVMVRLGPSPC